MPSRVRVATPEEEAAFKSSSGASTARVASPEEQAAFAKATATESAPEGPSAGRAVAEGALQGGSYGFGDELQGAIGAILRRSPGLGYPSSAEQGEENIFGRNSFVEDYRTERDAARHDREATEKAQPEAFNVSQIGAAMLTPGPKPGKTLGSFMKGGAKAGAAYGLGASDADVTKGEVGGATLDTVTGAGVGSLAGAVAAALRKPMQWGAQKLTEVGQRAFQRGVEKANKPIDAAINSARGSLGGEVAAGSRGIEVAEKAAVNPRLPEDVSRAAADALSDAEIQALEERVARAQIGGLHGRLPRIEKAQTAFDDAVEAGSPEARKAAVDALMSQSPMKRAAWEITKRIGPTLIGAGVGGQLGGTAGAGVGGVLGAITGATSGAPGRIMRNAVSSPQFQRSAAQAGTRVLDEALPGAMMGAASEQAGESDSKTREAARNVYEWLLQEQGK